MAPLPTTVRRLTAGLPWFHAVRAARTYGGGIRTRHCADPQPDAATSPRGPARSRTDRGVSRPADRRPMVGRCAAHGRPAEPVDLCGTPATYAGRAGRN